MIQSAAHAHNAEIMTPETPIRPEYERPPLVEQAISVAFQPLNAFNLVHFGLFWSEIAKEFPGVSTEPPLGNPTETFGEVRAQKLSFDLLQAPPMPRAMFRSGTGELVQLQVDRFGFNWAKEGGRDYPHSEVVMSRFKELFGRFSQFIERHGLGLIEFTQCELTNLNLIPVVDFGEGFHDMTKAFVVDPLDLGVPFLQPETYIRQRQHRIIAEDGAPIGRLHTVISPVVSHEDKSKAFRLELTARSTPEIRSLEEALWFFGVARNAINGAFQAITTPEMHARWGEKHG